MNLTQRKKLPDPLFRSRLVDRHTLDDKRLRNINNQLKTDPLDPLENQIVYLAGLDAVEYGNLFGYMHRRFGPPNYPADELKDFSAGWLLSTPHPDLYVKVVPVLSDGAIEDLGFFRYGWFQAHYACEGPVNGLEIEQKMAAFREALIATGKDLLRPVPVRDQYINPIGLLKDDDPLLERSEDDDTAVFAVSQARSSGRFIPAGLMGTSTWLDLMGRAYELGDGDYESGFKRLVSAEHEAPGEARPRDQG